MRPGFLGGDPDTANAVPGPALSSPARPAFRHGGGRCSRGRGRPRLAAGGSGLPPGGGGGGHCSPRGGGGGGPGAQETARGEAASPQAQLEAPLRAAGDPGQRHLRQSQEGHREVFGPSGEWGTLTPSPERGPDAAADPGRPGRGRGWGWSTETLVREGLPGNPQTDSSLSPQFPVTQACFSLETLVTSCLRIFWGFFSQQQSSVYDLQTLCSRWDRGGLPPGHAFRPSSGMPYCSNSEQTHIHIGEQVPGVPCPVREGEPPLSHSYSPSPGCCCELQGRVDSCLSFKREG